MSDAIKVSYATIEEAASACKTAGGQVESLFENLKSQIAPLTGSWTGEAQTAWQQRQDEWNRALEELNALLARIATALPQISEAYQSTDQGITKMFGG
ncbi:MAG TPA: WXG100 family type VII secretion target [Amycolatopsis sp.]|uniref:WXG100 family type VII secretion target n=1 Tax=Amycolatopsis sp. TaxID=37632 RepID=UPI002B479E86|nr:WXG100 family type VII secretion target [Amycolatopsis sp.]HKS49395.1 WXG100 family type VII secretion target [Amycolatopsis sp.]